MFNNAGKIALSGVMTGLVVAIMLMSSLLPSLSYALPMIAGAIIIIPSIEFGTGMALSAFTAAAVLSFLLPTDKESALMFVLLFGLYPIVKKYYEQINAKPLEWIVKFLHFNAAAIGAVALAYYIFSIPIDDGTLGRWGIPILLAIGNVAFLVYDIALTKFVTLYLAKIQPVLHKAFNIKK